MLGEGGGCMFGVASMGLNICCQNMFIKSVSNCLGTFRAVRRTKCPVVVVVVVIVIVTS